MNKLQMVIEQKPVHILHDTYKRECRYTRGLHISANDFENIVNRMCPDTKTYFEFHNIAKKIEPGTYFNGHAGLARHIQQYYEVEKGMVVDGLQDGRDFYVKVL